MDCFTNTSYSDYETIIMSWNKCIILRKIYRNKFRFIHTIISQHWSEGYFLILPRALRGLNFRDTKSHDSKWSGPGVVGPSKSELVEIQVTCSRYPINQSARWQCMWGINVTICWGLGDYPIKQYGKENQLTCFP